MMKEKTENLHEQFRNTSQSLQRKMAAVDENHIHIFIYDENFFYACQKMSAYRE